jgi:hypothetical protein
MMAAASRDFFLEIGGKRMTHVKCTICNAHTTAPCKTATDDVALPGARYCRNAWRSASPGRVDALALQCADDFMNMVGPHATAKPGKESRSIDVAQLTFAAHVIELLINAQHPRGDAHAGGRLPAGQSPASTKNRDS